MRVIVSTDRVNQCWRAEVVNGVNSMVFTLDDPENALEFGQSLAGIIECELADLRQ